jgi:hypothetical protein
MRKFRLSVEALTVESFETSRGGTEGMGTVRAHHHDTQPLPPASQTDEVHTACGSCDDSCYFGTCDTCANTCTCPPAGTGVTDCYHTCCSDPC